MKLVYLLFTLGYSQKIIKNINVPACKNCIHYKPSLDNSNFYSTCDNFGEKDIITNEIKYNYADLCRGDEDKCGNQGKYFQKEPNLTMKMTKHTFLSNVPLLLPILLVLCWRAIKKIV